MYQTPQKPFADVSPRLLCFRDVWADTSRFEGLTFKGPLEWLRQSRVKIVNESKELPVQVIHGAEAATLEKASRQNAEPELDLIEPRAMFGGEDETNPMGYIGQESGSGLHRLKDSCFPFDAEFICYPAVLCDQTNQGFRLVRVEIVGDEYPGVFGREVDGFVNVRREVLLGARRPRRRREYTACGDLESGDQGGSAMPFVLEFSSFGSSGAHGLRGRDELFGLNARLFIQADGVDAQL